MLYVTDIRNTRNHGPTTDKATKIGVSNMIKIINIDAGATGKSTKIGISNMIKIGAGITNGGRV